MITIAFDKEDPFWWYIEPGIAAVCDLINESGLGETDFSCEGHTLCERPYTTEGVDPYVLFTVLDRERAVQLVKPLLAIRGDGYHCDVRWTDEGSRTAVAVYLNVQTYHDFYERKGHRERRRAIERARAHLTEVFRQALAPDKLLFSCPARRCIHHHEHNEAEPKYRYSPGYLCAHPEGPSYTPGPILTYGSTQTCATRCPYYQRKHRKGLPAHG